MRRAAMPRLLLAALCALPVAPLGAQSVDEIIAKYYQAGGLDKYKGVDAMRVSGRMTFGQGMEAPFVTIKKRPNFVRLDLTIQGMTVTQSFDGQNAWMVNPLMGQSEPQLLPPDMARGMEEEADFDGPLMAYKDRGVQVELVGQEQVEGVNAYKLKLTMKSGDVTYYFMDAGTYLPIRTEAKRTMQGQEMSIVTSIGDYRSEGGLILPHSMQISGETPGGRSITIEKVELNPTVKAEDFKMPPKPGGDR